MVTRKEIIEEIRRITTSNNGKPLGLDAFKRLTGIRESDWRGIFWERWSDAPFGGWLSTWCIQYALMIRPVSKATGTVASRTVEQTANGSS
jgi:hypothetical protein